MAEQFRDQGGAASMDPGPLTRWLTSAIMTRLSAPARVDRLHAAAERQRIKQRATHRGLRKVVEAAGLDWSEAQHLLGEAGWEDILEENRLAMYDAGLWGVPSFSPLGSDDEQLLALWGQVRLWLFAREIERQLRET